MNMMAPQITGIPIVCSTVCLCADQRKHQTSASLAFVRGIHRWPVDFPHKRPEKRQMVPFDNDFKVRCLGHQQIVKHISNYETNTDTVDFELWRWTNNFIPHFTGHLIIYTSSRPFRYTFAYPHLLTGSLNIITILLSGRIWRM